MRFLLATSLVIVASHAFAGNDGRWDNAPPEQREWFKAQVIPYGPQKGTSCCSQADGTEVLEDMEGNNYKIKITIRTDSPYKWKNGTKTSDWIIVPNEAIVEDKSRYGPIAWWAIGNNYNNIIYDVFIRCYKPGPKT